MILPGERVFLKLRFVKSRLRSFCQPESTELFTQNIFVKPPFWGGTIQELFVILWRCSWAIWYHCKRYDNLNHCLRIVLTLPCTVVSSGERLFSKLRFVKNCLGSSFNQELLEALLVFSTKTFCGPGCMIKMANLNKDGPSPNLIHRSGKRTRERSINQLWQLDREIVS